MSSGQPARIASIDVLRAITMLLMIFVNDLWSLKDVPVWLEHTKAQEDGMGLADVVFPAFLVIVGMSVPFSITSRHSKGESTSSVILHIILRSLALLVMGLFLVNGENISESASGLPRGLWNTLACLSFIFIWNAYPKSTNRVVITVLKVIGWLILLILAWIYRGGDAGLRFGPLWWGILGLIGWAYLISALVYTTFRANLYLICVFWLFCLGICIVSHANLIPADSLLRSMTSPFGGGAMPAFVTTGIITSIIFTRLQSKANSVRLMGILLLTSGLLVAAGFYLRQFWGISKILATPAWVLICSGVTIAAFVIIYWIADLRGKANWFDFIRPAGTNTLVCYLLPYFAYALIYGLLQPVYPDIVSTGIIGLAKSMAFSLAIIWIAGLLGKAGVRLKL